MVGGVTSSYCLCHVSLQSEWMKGGSKRDDRRELSVHEFTCPSNSVRRLMSWFRGKKRRTLGSHWNTGKHGFRLSCFLSVWLSCFPCNRVSHITVSACSFWWKKKMGRSTTKWHENWTLYGTQPLTLRNKLKTFRSFGLTWPFHSVPHSDYP